MENSNCIIITHKEWSNFLAFGYLRVSPSRISYFDGDAPSFEVLMSYSAVSALNEDDSFLLVSLVDGYSCRELYIARTPYTNYISIQAVQGFYSLSKNALDLLEDDALKSHSIVNYDQEIEELWFKWKNHQIQLREHEKGNNFLEILGYPIFKQEPKIDDDTLFHRVLKSYTRDQLTEGLKNISNKNTFSWFFTSDQFGKINGSIYTPYKKLRKDSKNIEFKDLSKTYITQKSKYLSNENSRLIEHPSLIAEKIFFDKISNYEDYFLATSFLVHYYNLLDNNLEIELLFLESDLAFLNEVYSKKNISQLIIYFIGRRLNEVYLSFLYIAQKIDQKNLSMFDEEFFSNLKKKKLKLGNIDQVQLQKITSNVNVIAEEIQRAYNVNVNNVQESESGSDAIEEKDDYSNQPTQSQAPMTDSDNGETNNSPLNEKVDIPSNTTNEDSTHLHLEAQYSVDSKNSKDSTNKTGDSNQPTQSQATITENGNIKINKTLLDEKVDIPSNTTNDDFIQPLSDAQELFDSEESENNTKYIDKSNEIGCNTNPSNLSTTTSNESNAIRYGQVQEAKENISKQPSGQIDFLETIKEDLPLIDPRKLLDDALNTIEELPKDKKNNGASFQVLFISKNDSYKDNFKDLNPLSKFFEDFARILGKDMRKHKKFSEFKKELMSYK